MFTIALNFMCFTVRGCYNDLASRDHSLSTVKLIECALNVILFFGYFAVNVVFRFDKM